MQDPEGGDAQTRKGELLINIGMELIAAAKIM